MNLGNRIVQWLLQSPAHRVLSGSTDLVRYQGRRSGRTIITPTQYATSGDDLVILVGRPDTKTWWRNFRDRNDIDVLVKGSWRAMTARAVVGTDEPDQIVPLLNAYCERFPKARRLLSSPSGATDVGDAVIVWCRPNTPDG